MIVIHVHSKFHSASICVWNRQVFGLLRLNEQQFPGFCWLVEDIAENIVESGIKRYKPLMKYCIAVKPV
jgi:hypothetical protein